MIECQIMMHTLPLLRIRVRCVCVNDLYAMYTRVEVRDILTVIFVFVCSVCLLHEKNTDTCITKLQSSLAKQAICRSAQQIQFFYRYNKLEINDGKT